MGCNIPIYDFKPRLKTERIKILKVVDEAAGQLVVSASTCINAMKIDRINARLLNSTDHPFRNMIIKQGVIRTEIFFVNPQNAPHYISTDLPFMLAVDIPGFEPDECTEIQNHLLDIEVDYKLIPAQSYIPGRLQQVITAHILLIAAKWEEIDVVTASPRKSEIYSETLPLTNPTSIID
jgi:hypothetical protein